MTAYQAEGIAIADKEGEWVFEARRGEVVGPVVEAAGGGHGGTQVGHGGADEEDEEGGKEPAL